MQKIFDKNIFHDFNTFLKKDVEKVLSSKKLLFKVLTYLTELHIW